MTNATTAVELRPLLSRLGGRVLTVGDIMLDRYSFGSVSRISPEAPIPILKMGSEREMVGGAGNVARNVAALGGNATVVSVVGDDEAGVAVACLLRDESGVSDTLVRCPGRPTTVKTRFMAAGQQVLRVDREEAAPIPSAIEDSVVAQVGRALPNADALVLSDYGKGVLTPAVLSATLGLARRRGIPVIVDPKRRDMSAYAGATCLTPNADELALATGLPTESDPDVVAAARALMNSVATEFVLVTRSEKGATLVPRSGEPTHIPANRREIFDVSGAGDTVVGCLATALAGGIGWPDAVALANVAAGIVVGKQGTATCTRAELDAELSGPLFELAPKLLTIQQASERADRWRRHGLRIGFTNGCFDLIHPGHVSLIQRARQQCDRLVVGLNSDGSVRRLKGPTRPLQSEAARAAVLAAISGVDAVTVFEEDTPMRLIEAVRPALLFKGADYSLDQVVGGDWVVAQGGQVRLIGLVEGESTSAIIRRAG